jgi:hypothetical protein
MKKFFFTATLTALIAACTPVTMPETASPVVPAPGAVKTIGYDAYNAPATAYLKEMLGKTAKVMVSIDAKELPLTSAETAGLLALLDGVKSAAPRCAPADCFYLNLYDAEGKWLMSQPVQKTPEGIVLLYLKLQGNNAAAPLQTWWQGISNRLSL